MLLEEAEKEWGDQGRNYTPVLKPRVCPDSYSEPQCCIGGAQARLGILVATRCVWCASSDRLSSAGDGVGHVKSIPLFTNYFTNVTQNNEKGD
jgi:hypothetical protein